VGSDWWLLLILESGLVKNMSIVMDFVSYG
jgi:hypothetical protein